MAVLIYKYKEYGIKQENRAATEHAAIIQIRHQFNLPKRNRLPRQPQAPPPAELAADRSVRDLPLPYDLAAMITAYNIINPS